MQIQLTIADAELRFEALTKAAATLRTIRQAVKVSGAGDWSALGKIAAALEIMAEEVDAAMLAKALPIMESLTNGQQQLFEGTGARCTCGTLMLPCAQHPANAA